MITQTTEKDACQRSSNFLFLLLGDEQSSNQSSKQRKSPSCPKTMSAEEKERFYKQKLQEFERNQLRF